MYAKRSIGFDWGSAVSSAINAASSVVQSTQATKQAQQAANIAFYNAQAAQSQAAAQNRVTGGINPTVLIVGAGIVTGKQIGRASCRERVLRLV